MKEKNNRKGQNKDRTEKQTNEKEKTKIKRNGEMKIDTRIANEN